MSSAAPSFSTESASCRRRPAGDLHRAVRTAGRSVSAAQHAAAARRHGPRPADHQCFRTARSGRHRRAGPRLHADLPQGRRERHPTIHARESWVILPIREALIGPVQPAILGTAAAAFLLMLIVCANIAGLSAVNAAAQRQHYAIRTALGASAGQIFRDRLRESLILATIGSAAGLGLASFVVEVVARYQRYFLPTLATVTFDVPTAIAGFLLGAATGVIAAAAPQGAIARLQIDDPLRAARGTTTDRRLTAVRSGLVVVQVAVAIVLMVGAGLLVRTVGHLSATALGYESERIGYIHVTLPQPRYRTTEAHLQFERDLLERVSAIPGVSGASASVGFPVMGSMGARLTILNRPDPVAPPEIAYYSVTPRFFSFLDVPIVEGRDIAETDNFPAPRVVVINETMARMFWPTATPSAPRSRSAPALRPTGNHRRRDRGGRASERADAGHPSHRIRLDAAGLLAAAAHRHPHRSADRVACEGVARRRP